MKILVVGGGGREHALAWRLARSGHAGHRGAGQPRDRRGRRMRRRSRVGDVDGPGRRSRIAEQSTWSWSGPEAPLVAGLADRLRAAGWRRSARGADGARLEGSKVFAKQFFAAPRHPDRGVRAPCRRAVRRGRRSAIDRLGRRGRGQGRRPRRRQGRGRSCDGAEAARGAAREMLAAAGSAPPARGSWSSGASPAARCRCWRSPTAAGLLVLPAVEDHKTIFDGDRGPNTGGMGTVSPAWASRRAARPGSSARSSSRPCAGLRAEGIDYRGVLYAGPDDRRRRHARGCSSTTAGSATPRPSR